MATRLSSWKCVEPALVDQRRGVRRRIEVARADLGAAGDPPVPVELAELSTFGCRLAGDADVGAGERVWVSLAGAAKVPGVVVWNREGAIGCRFDTPIDRSLMRTLVLGAD